MKEQTTVNGRKYNHWGDNIKRAEIANDRRTEKNVHEKSKLLQRKPSAGNELMI